MKKKHLISLIFSSAFFCIFFPLTSLAQIEQTINIPLTFDKYSRPHAHFVIDGIPIYTAIDTGSVMGFHLEESQLTLLKGIKKKQYYRSIDAAGKRQENIEYIIDSVNVNNFILKNVAVTPYQQWGWLMSDQDELPHGPVAGLGAFTDKQILIDYASNSLMISDNTDAGKLINADFTSFPYQMTPDGLVFDVEQSGHRYRMILDTGSTASIIWKERLKDHKTVSCLLVDPEMDNEGCEATLLKTVSTTGFPMQFAAVVIPGPFTHMGQIDGLLGNNFLKNRKIFIDLKNKKLYVTDEHKQG